MKVYKNMHDFRFFIIGLLIGFIIISLLNGCTDERSAVNVLNSSGFTEIKITGYRFLSCPEQMACRTGFSALSPSGIRVSGTVCSTCSNKIFFCRFINKGNIIYLD